MDETKDFRGYIVLGNVRLRACNLRRYLKKSQYWLRYDFKTARMELWANHGHGGEVIIEAENVPFETAERFAKELGLNKEGSRDTWYKWNPVVTLRFDGSADAIELRRELLELGIPFHQYKSNEGWEFEDGHGCYSPPMWTKNKILEEIRKIASRYQESLSTIP